MKYKVKQNDIYFQKLVYLLSVQCQLNINKFDLFIISRLTEININRLKFLSLFNLLKIYLFRENPEVVETSSLI